MNFIKESAPHLQKGKSLGWMLGNVLIALAPVFIWSFIIYPIPSLQIYPISIVTCLASEFVFILITKKKVSEFKIENILSAIITGIIYAMCLPTDLSFSNGLGYFIVFIGALLGMILGKLVFGGFGNNIFNPAALGMVIVRAGWGSKLGVGESAFPDWVEAGGTHFFGGSFSEIANVNLLDSFLGRAPGALGETFAIAILIGLVYLLVTKTIDWRVVVSFFGTFIVLMLAAGIVVQVKLPESGVNAGKFLLYQLLSGGVLFGGVYMMTDPVTGPAGSPARYIYGAFGAIMVTFIRLFMHVGGVGYSILFANLLACVLDYPQWTSSRWKKWHIITLPVMIVVALAAVILVLVFKEGAVA